MTAVQQVQGNESKSKLTRLFHQKFLLEDEIIRKPVLRGVSHNLRNGTESVVNIYKCISIKQSQQQQNTHITRENKPKKQRSGKEMQS